MGEEEVRKKMPVSQGILLPLPPDIYNIAIKEISSAKINDKLVDECKEILKELVRNKSLKKKIDKVETICIIKEDNDKPVKIVFEESSYEICNE